MTSISEIPSRLRVPLAYVDISNLRAVMATPDMPFKVLYLGNMTDAGRATPLEMTRVMGDDQAEQLFGVNSQLAEMFRAGKKASRLIETWAIPIADKADGVKASGTIQFALQEGGVKSGALYLYITDHGLVVSVAEGATAAAIATAVVTAVNADKTLPVTAAIDGEDTGTVKLTAVHKGLFGNQIGISLNYNPDERTPVGLDVTITAMADGVGNPDVAAAIAAMGDEWWNYVVVGYSDTANVNKVKDALAGRWGPTKMMDSQMVTTFIGTHAESTTYTEQYNSKFVIALTPGKILAAPWAFSAATLMAAAVSLSDDPARPLHTLVVPGQKPPRQKDRWNMEERNIALYSGGSTFSTDAGGQVLIEGFITTYRVNAYDVADPSYLYVTTLATLAYLRWSIRARITQKYPRHKLANDGTNYAAGQPIVTPGTIRAELISLFREWESKALVENFEQFKSELIVERDLTDRNRVNVILGPDLVNQFTIFAAQIQFIL